MTYLANFSLTKGCEMKKQITVFAFVGAVLIGGGYLLGANAKSPRETNRERYAPFRSTWALVVLRSSVSNANYDNLKVSYAIEDLGGNRDDLKCVIQYSEHTSQKTINLVNVDTKKRLDYVLDWLGLDVKVVEKYVNLSDRDQLQEYLKWEEARKVQIAKILEMRNK